MKKPKIKKTKSKVKEGESLVYRGTFFVVQETFAADGTFWVRCTYGRKNYKVKYNGRTYHHFERENTYMSENEWRIKQKT